MASILHGWVPDFETSSGPSISNGPTPVMALSNVGSPYSFKANRTMNSAKVPLFIFKRMSEYDVCQKLSIEYCSSFPAMIRRSFPPNTYSEYRTLPSNNDKPVLINLSLWT